MKTWVVLKAIMLSEKASSKGLYTVIISFTFEMRKSIQMENRLLAAND